MAKVTKVVDDGQGDHYYFTNDGEAFGFSTGWGGRTEAEEVQATIEMIESGACFFAASAAEKATLEFSGKVIWEA